MADAIWEETFGVTPKAYTNGEVFGGQNQLQARFLDPGVATLGDLFPEGLEIHAGANNVILDPQPWNYSAVVGVDEILSVGTDRFVIEVDFTFFSETVTVTTDYLSLFSFVSSNLPKVVETYPNFAGEHFLSVQVGEYAGGYLVYIILKEQSTGFEQWYNGTSMSYSREPVSGILLLPHRKYSLHVMKDLAQYRVILSDINAGAPGTELVNITFAHASYQSGPGWWFVGDFWSDTSEAFFMTLQRLYGERGLPPLPEPDPEPTEDDTLEFSFPDPLPAFTKFEQKVRSKESSFSRMNFDSHYDDGTHVFLPAFRVVEVPEGPFDQYYELGSDEEGRLDLVSYKFYGTTRLWWVLAMANQIKEPYRVAPGTQIRVPSIATIHNNVLNKIGSVYGR